MTAVHETIDGMRRFVAARLVLAIVCACLSFQAVSESAPGSGPRIDNGLVSWLITDRTLRDVLHQLGEQADFAVTVSEALPVQVVSREFDLLPLGQTLEQLLDDQNYIIDRSADKKIRSVYLFAVGEAAAPAHVSNGAARDETSAGREQLVANMMEQLPPGTLTQVMKDALIQLADPPSEAEIAELRSRQDAIFEQFKSHFGNQELTTGAEPGT